MDNQVYIKPGRPCLIVRDPDTGIALAEDGDYKPRTTYWIRRKNAGDVVDATPPPVDSAAPVAQAKGKVKANDDTI